MLEKKKVRLLHIHRSTAATRPLIRRMLQKDPTLANIYLLSSTQLSEDFHIPFERANKLFIDLHNRNHLASLISDLRKYKVVTIFDESYPPMLKTINDPPLVLYFLGNPDLFFQMPALSVVGTRNPSMEAKNKMNYLLMPIIQQGWVIVSGMAKGIDGYAHKLAMESKGKTIAVLGSGLNQIYPKEHTGLFEQLKRTQLIISEYPPNTPPRRHYFPERNRIISGLGYGTIVIEAKQKSGSLITVDQALDQGREVYAVPDSPLIIQSSGCHKMIQDGAKLVQNTYDLLEDWETQSGKWGRIMSEFTEKRSF